jgi:Tfp pilus assembly protein PilF
MDKCVLHYLTMWKHARAEELCRELLEVERRREPADPAKLAERLELLGFSILEQGQHSEAEPLLRESLNIYQAHPPAETWRLANIQSMLGEALTGMKNLAEAEPLLLDAHKTLGDPANAIPDYFSRDPVAKSLTRLVKLYKALDRRDEAGKWQAKLDERNAKPKQTSGKSEE